MLERFDSSHDTEKKMHPKKSDAAFLRQELHKIPEQGFKEYKTQKYMLDYLSKLGYRPEKCASTGVICFIDMGKKTTVALRSDMDGLRIREETPLQYRSVHADMMHACGHDGHMSMLLAAAKGIHNCRRKFDDNVLLIFQPAEEGPGGAKKIIAENVLGRYHVKCVLAMHLSPDYEKGKLAVREGEFFAGGAELYFDIAGMAAHGAQPEKGKDALMAGVNLVEALHMDIAEKINSEDGVMSLGTFEAGSAMNIIAGRARISGILRAFNMDERARILSQITDICAHVQSETGCTVGFKPVLTYPPLINDVSLARKVSAIIGAGAVQAQKNGADGRFAFYTYEAPSVMIAARRARRGAYAALHSASSI
jgi:hippurate hydrolase